MAEEDLMKEENVLAQVESGEKFLRREEEQPEVVELPLNVDRVQAKQAQLQREISVCKAQITELANKMDTAQLAFQQCVVLLRAEETTDGS